MPKVTLGQLQGIHNNLKKTDRDGEPEYHVTNVGELIVSLLRASRYDLTLPIKTQVRDIDGGSAIFTIATVTTVLGDTSPNEKWHLWVTLGLKEPVTEI